MNKVGINFLHGQLKTNKMYTYLATDGKRYKIGKSKNPIKRVNGMKTSNPDIILVAYIEQDLEKDLHEKYKDKHIVREWYNLNQIDLEELLKSFKKHIPKEKKRGRKPKHTFKDMKFRILQMANVINSSSLKENNYNRLKEDLEVKGFYKIEVLKDCHFIVYASSLFSAMDYLEKIRIHTNRIISYSLIDPNEDEITLEYSYQDNEFMYCYLRDIGIPLKEGVVCDDFIDYGYDSSKIFLEGFVDNY